jgi:hypothetical protein
MADQAKHSPGPWRWGEAVEGGAEIHMDSLVDAAGNFTLVYGGHATGADRALIAAAPELLAMLKKHEYTEDDGMFGLICLECGMPKVKERRRRGAAGHEPDCALAALIAKAEGESGVVGVQSQGGQAGDR